MLTQDSAKTEPELWENSLLPQQGRDQVLSTKRLSPWEAVQLVWELIYKNHHLEREMEAATPPGLKLEHCTSKMKTPMHTFMHIPENS